MTNLGSSLIKGFLIMMMREFAEFFIFLVIFSIAFILYTYNSAPAFF